MVAGIEAAKRRGLSTVGKTAGVGKEGQQDGDGAFSQARDAVEQFALPFQVGVGNDVLIDGLDQRLDC